jgi:mono/diheme cytochrome c family protein
MWRPSSLRAGVGCWAVAGLAVLWAGCSRPGGPGSFSESEFPVPDAGTPAVIPIVAAPKCTPAQSSQSIPARSSLTSAQDGGVVASQPIYFTADLYNLFKSVCGSCHVESNFGGFLVTPSSFPVVVPSFTYLGNSVYQIMTSDDPTLFMPPPTYGGIPYSQRPPDDAQRTLANLMQQWLAQGAPVGSFNLATDPNATTTTGYAVSPTMSSQITNIGTCVPDQGMVGTDTSAMDQLDTFFAQATGLPATLDQTDLVTLDSEALAKNGVISYAPTYPLWSDNAQKMRYVRVPRGQSIMLDKATQQFQIPPNTRFYKTFLKSVIDVNGNQAYRKIETRLIVSRPDTNNPDGTVVQNALYGTYLWNDDESQASLLTDPLRDGKPFADRLFSYTTDEKQAQVIIAQNPTNLAGALDDANLTRHYAVPSAERCVQCHMGSPSESFILGFTPLQVSRRPNGSGGLYEAASGDELTQLQRLIDYGVVSGVKSAADILPLEQSEGSRTPRNDYELAAQAYMVGNCAHCHNDRGFPTEKQPALKGLLTFLPGPGPHQGIFQMPLTLNSPIRNRGSSQDVPIPYITPSVYDLASVEATPKYFCRDASGKQCSTAAPATQWFVLAPWRSLIYRNTDTPYDYFDDFTPFPHMPLNSPGYDCRVSKIMGDWMVSIPSEPKDPTKIEDLILVNVLDAQGNLPPDADTDPQPYVEVLPGDPTYAQAVSDANTRLQDYHNGFRYGFCPDTYTKDIIDKNIQQEVNAGAPVTSDIGAIDDPTGTFVLMPPLAPLSPNWVNFDDTEPPGDWFPRRPDLMDALVNPDITSFVQQADPTDPQAAEDLTNVLTELENVSLTSEVKSLVTQPVPFGLWQTAPGCDFSSIRTAGSFQGADRPSWMQVLPPPDNAPVYVQSYGSAVFNSVCFNCHGPKADAQGLLADEISLLTGGDARVADFRDGLFGPLDQPGSNIDRVYGPGATTLGGGLTAEDVASRYMAWMALGGTSKHLPVDVLNQVSESPVLGTERAHIALAGTPDMLRIGLELCEEIASSDSDSKPTSYTVGDLVSFGRYTWGSNTGLIDTNGDAEMWLHLCSLGNRPIVRAPLVNGGVWTADSTLHALSIDDTTLYWGADDMGHDLYGAHPVMDQHGNVTTGIITPDNGFPLCIPKPTSTAETNIANAVLAASPINGNVIPYCPAGIVQASNKLKVDDSGDHVDGRRWAARGAINAALAVFLYLEGIESDPSSRPVPYNQCNLLPSTK